MPSFSSNRAAIAAQLVFVVALAIFAASASSPSSAQDMSKSQSTDKRTILITGANRGIGLEFAKQ